MTVEPHQSIRITHVDRPDLSETFVDSVHATVWDGQTLRVELCVTRYPDTPPVSPAEVKRYPAARLVLTAPAVADLCNRLQQTMQALVQAGVLPAPQQPK